MIPGVEDKLNEAFAKQTDKRIILYWYDEEQQYANEIDEYHLQNAKILKVNEKHYFSLKYQLEIRDKTSNYLLYAPFKQPSDRENPIADIIHYAEPFYADRVSLLLQDLGYAKNLRPVVEKYIKFWDNKDRLKKYTDLHLTKPEDKDVCLGILAVLSGTSTTKISEILIKVILESPEDNKYLKRFEKCGIDGFFWECCAREYGYRAETPSLDKLIRTLFVTDLYKQIIIPEKIRPAAWSQYAIENPETVPSLTAEIRRNTDFKAEYQTLAEKYETLLNPQKYLFEQLKEEIPIEAYISCDIFECFDRKILDYLTNYLTNSKETYPESFKSIRLEREKLFFTKKHENEYTLLGAASQFLKVMQVFETRIDAISKIDDILDQYQSEWLYIDMDYRQFYEAYDSLEDNEPYQALRTLIEHTYTIFLEKLNTSWTKAIAQSSIQNIPLPKQQNFYAKYVEPETKNSKLVVIISDGLRYETALELSEELNKKQNYNSDVSPIFSTLPSKTELGMAALLPHRTLSISTENDVLNVLVDNLPVRGKKEREVVLKKYNEASVVLNFKDLSSMNRADLQKEVENKKVIYIYHNTIDAIGDKAATEEQVFKACRDTIEEIKKLINRFNQQHSISRYIVTADHGFLYLRNKIPESAKISVEKQEGDLVAKRFIIGREPTKTQGTFSYSLQYLGNETSHLHVSVPRGIDLFKHGGSGLQYVHGGASIQESVIPVLSLKTQRGKEEYGSAGLVILKKQKITGLTFFIDFMQKYQVKDNIKPLQARIYIVDKEGQRVTAKDEFIIANCETDRPVFHKKFTLISGKGYTLSDTYTLIIEDTETETEYERFDYVIDIPFTF